MLIINCEFLNDGGGLSGHYDIFAAVVRTHGTVISADRDESEHPVHYRIGFPSEDEARLFLRESFSDAEEETIEAMIQARCTTHY